jgi:hypothetical protein
VHVALPLLALGWCIATPGGGFPADRVLEITAVIDPKTAEVREAVV